MPDPRPATTSRPPPSPNPAAVPAALTDIPSEVKLAENAKLSTRRALLLGSKAAATPTYPNLMAAAQAQLDAGRPAAAKRWAQEAAACDAPGENDKAMHLCREADAALAAVPRARERGVEVVVAALVETLGAFIGDGSDEFRLGALFMAPKSFGEVGEELTALDLLNRALSKVGGAGLEMRMDEDRVVSVRRIPLRPDRVAAHTLLAEVDASGAPCHGCGAPRWTFAHDARLGEFCGQCGWPLPAAEFNVTSRQKSIEELREEAATLQAQVAERDATLLARDREIATMQGRIDRATRSANGLHKQMRAGRFRGPVEATAVPTGIPADATIEELQEQARQALALAQAGRARVEEIAVELARRNAG